MTPGSLSFWLGKKRKRLSTYHVLECLLMRLHARSCVLRRREGEGVSE